MTNRPTLEPEEKRQSIYDRLSAIGGGLSTETLTGFPGFPLSLMNDAGVREKVAGLLTDIIADASMERSLRGSGVLNVALAKPSFPNGLSS
ncbi:hypothetical protein [Altererythrobacter xiamenensis]|uniref:hypothetical protein n=1 Tax=Altererythrobacter xiamenensis TaxID=1316679 RepID=UPI000A36A4B3|nr:hypothetical protein [Altererythrobacter xiamenensis]